MGKPKILYVDDEIINLMLFEANLEDEYNILIADNGLSGLEIISHNSDIEFVFSDMKMPIMNGIEFIKQANTILPQVPFYILTGFEITDEIQTALDNKLIRKYFKKPFNINEITSEIASVLQEKNN